MRIKMSVKYDNDSEFQWNENYDIDENENPEEYAKTLIQNFNDTLRPNELPRKLIYVEVLDKLEKFS